MRVSELKYQARFGLPLWLVGVATNWWPDNRVTIRARGWLVERVLRTCGHGLTLGRDVTLLRADRLVLGKHVYLAKGVWVNAIGGVTLEDEVVMGPYTVVASSNHGFRNGSVRFGGGHPAPVLVGRGTWIGAHAVVTAGARVGRGNVVGANAVFSRTSPDDVVVGGIPARVIRVRGEDVPGVQTSDEHEP